jgi:hypothetical protein
MERNRLEHAPKALHRDLNAHIDYLRKQIKQADHDLDHQVRDSALWDIVRGAAQCAGSKFGIECRAALCFARIGPAQPRRNRCIGRGCAIQ